MAPQRRLNQEVKMGPVSAECAPAAKLAGVRKQNVEDATGEVVTTM